jgi:type I restriction-modification system DNA methylase subunit
MSQQSLPTFIWSAAALFRGDFKQIDSGKVIMPFNVLRRLDCVLDATKPAVLKELIASAGGAPCIEAQRRSVVSVALTSKSWGYRLTS